MYDATTTNPPAGLSRMTPAELDQWRALLRVSRHPLQWYERDDPPEPEPRPYAWSVRRGVGFTWDVGFATLSGGWVRESNWPSRRQAVDRLAFLLR